MVERILAAASDDVWKAAISAVQIVMLALIAGLFGRQRSTARVTQDIQGKVNGGRLRQQAEIDLLKQQLREAGIEPGRLMRRQEDVP